MVTFEVMVRELDNNKEATIELPNDRYVEELTEAFGESWIDHDYEIVDVEDDYAILHSFRLYGFQSLSELNDIAKRVEEVCDSNYMVKTLQASAEVFTDIKEALDLIEEGSLALHENQSMEDIAENYVEEGLFGDVNEKLSYYIDYERLGRDIMLDGGYTETKYGILEELR